MKAKVLKATLSLRWTGASRILAVGPSPSDSTPNGRPLAARLLYMDVPNNMSGADTHGRVSGSPLQTQHQSTRHNRPSPIPSRWTKPMGPNNYTAKSPPFHVTEDEVSVPVKRL